MDKRFDFKFKPFPDEKFAQDATVKCVGARVTNHLGNAVGHVTKYEIDMHGDLWLTVEQD